MKKPLVTICIPNYNYGQYLRYCLNSVYNQTYENIEVHFSDNASTDDSYEIAQEYRKKFKEKGIYFKVVDNKRNVGSERNSQIAYRDAEGDFQYILASDDAIKPTFIERCIGVFENNPNVSAVLTHREEIDENGNIHQIPPFYNVDCIVDHESQAAVYMMAGIAIPGQRMVRQTALCKFEMYLRQFQVAGDWYNNFLYTLAGDIAYITEPLCQYRVHSGNETNESELKLLGSFEHYQLINTFCEVANSCGMTKPQMRYEEAVNKLGTMCLRYALKMYKNKRNDVAYRYLLLAPVYYQQIVDDDRYKELFCMKDLQGIELEKSIAAYDSKYELERRISYDPPAGFLRIDKKGRVIAGKQ